MAVEKWIRDGKVAVIVSPGFGAGWSTWNTEINEETAFDKGLAELVEAGKPLAEIEAYAEQKWPGACLLGLDQLEVEWIDVGTKFTIHEYDGSESLRLIEDLSMTA